jgi:hypothetical protein
MKARLPFSSDLGVFAPQGAVTFQAVVRLSSIGEDDGSGYNERRRRLLSRGGGMTTCAGLVGASHMILRNLGSATHALLMTSQTSLPPLNRVGDRRLIQRLRIGEDRRSKQ